MNKPFHVVSAPYKVPVDYCEGYTRYETEREVVYVEAESRREARWKALPEFRRLVPGYNEGVHPLKGMEVHDAEWEEEGEKP